MSPSILRRIAARLYSVRVIVVRDCVAIFPDRLLRSTNQITLHEADLTPPSQPVSLTNTIACVTHQCGEGYRFFIIANTVPAIIGHQAYIN